MKIAIIGTGTMGTGLVQLIAQNGHEVFWKGYTNDNISKSFGRIEKTLDKLVEKGKITSEDKLETLKRVTIVDDFSKLSEMDLIIEAITENLEIKKEFFKMLCETVSEKTILASNTSSLSITEIASSTNRADKVIGLHFFNPAPLMKLVEVISGISTSKETSDFCLDFCKKIGKTPVVVEEVPGFVVNRILIPMINEAIGIYNEGVATVEGIDEAMKLGANHPMGPLALADLIGLDVCLNIMDILHKEYGDDKYRAHHLLKKMVRGNKLGRKTGEGFYKY